MRRLLLTTASVIALGFGGIGIASAHVANTNQSGLPGGSTPSATTQTHKTDMRMSSQRMSRGQIKQAQMRLRADHLYRGRIDGVFGPKTKTALEQFQRRNKLPVTAKLDHRTSGRLLGGAMGQGSSATPSRNLGQGSSTMPNGGNPASTMGQGSSPPQNGVGMNPAAGQGSGNPGTTNPSAPSKPDNGTKPIQK